MCRALLCLPPYTTSAHMEHIEPTAPRKGPLRDMSLNGAIDPDYRPPGGRWSKFTDEVGRAPEVAAVCAPLHPRGAPPTTGTSTAGAAQDDDAMLAGVHDDERAVSTTLRAAGPGPTKAVEHSAAADGEVGSGLDRPANAALALSSSVMPNDPRSLRPARAALTGSLGLELDVLSTLRPAGQLPKAVAPGVQTPMPTYIQPLSTQQPRALTTDSRPASAARLADKNQESSAPAAPNANHIFNAGSPAVARVYKILDDFRNAGNKENVPPSSAAQPGAGLSRWRIPKPRYTNETVQWLLAEIDAILAPTPAPAPAPASPAESDRPDSPSSSGPWTPPPPQSPGTRSGMPVDPDEDVPLLELPPAVYSVSFVAPKRIVVDSFLEYPDKLPIPFPIDAEMLTLLRGQNPGGDEENANAGNVADDEDEPQEYALCPLIVPPAAAA